MPDEVEGRQSRINDRLPHLQERDEVLDRFGIKVKISGLFRDQVETIQGPGVRVGLDEKVQHKLIDMLNFLNLATQANGYGWRFLAFGRSALPWPVGHQGSC